MDDFDDDFDDPSIVSDKNQKIKDKSEASSSKDSTDKDLESITTALPGSASY